MAFVASQLIEEVTSHAQKDSLEDAREICADGTYFQNNLRSYLLNPGKNKRFLPTPKRPGCLWDHISLLFGRYCGSFLGNKSVGACSLALSSIQCGSQQWVVLYFYSLVHLHGLYLCNASES